MNTAVVHMKQQAVATYGAPSLTAADVRAQINLIQDVLRSVMIEGTHYGTIPGTKTASLYKPGAEKIMATFKLAADPEVEDLSTSDEVHYRVKVKLNSPSGQFLGAGIGECGSAEEKYAWRRPVCDEEFEATVETRRRIKFAKWQGKVERQKQIRTNHADVRNTVLKMAKKRGLVDAVLTVTAASDIFTQDIEDLPDELKDQIAEDVRARSPGKAATASIVPEESPERDAAIAECRAAAGRGKDVFLEFWKDYPKEKRLLVADQMDSFKAMTEGADATANA